MRELGWVRAVPRRAWVGLLVATVAIGVVALVLVTRDDAQEVIAADESTSTTEDPTTTTTTEATTTTTEATTTTTQAPATTMAPTTSTAPPPTAPPTTVPAAPTEFEATVRGVDHGPDYYGIFHGTTFGASGGFHVIAKCRAGTVRVTVLEDGWNGARPDMAPSYPTSVWVWADGNELAYNKSVSDGIVISGPVTAEVAVRTSGPSEQDMRIQYDCRG